MPYHTKIDLRGQKFGRLTVIKDSGKRTRWGHVIWICKCRCGRKRVKIIGSNLRHGYSRSCGCLGRERMKTLGRGNVKHRECKNSRLYTAWINLKRKCYNPNAINFDRYGGRGVQVCKEWLDEKLGYINFRTWAIANGYTASLRGFVIDRLDCRRNYYGPDNCQFLTRSESTKKRIQRKRRVCDT